ncbi:hypothetical protein FGO68_gene10072 [Halteria grandinella]|uniref:Uncharacterized protein n=1 Tax=Halteria grandinella TaxID=5974 RepID=A0A8J8NDS8_HALGN|nr:hypothetical protein FGO68_gene10072 [Halteria grandinella]
MRIMLPANASSNQITPRIPNSARNSTANESSEIHFPLKNKRHQLPSTQLSSARQHPKKQSLSKEDFQSLNTLAAQQTLSKPTLKRSTSTSHMMTAHQRTRQVHLSAARTINQSLQSPRARSNSHTRSVVSLSQVSRQRSFKARPFVDKSSSFLVKRSVKVLTIPQQFNLQTDQRAVERSHSKKSRNNDTNISVSSKTPERQHGRRRRHKPIPVEKPEIETEAEPSSLFQQLINEYGLGEAYNQVKEQERKSMSPVQSQHTKNNRSEVPPYQDKEQAMTAIERSNFASTFGGSLSLVKIEDCYYLPRQ